MQSYHTHPRMYTCTAHTCALVKTSSSISAYTTRSLCNSLLAIICHISITCNIAGYQGTSCWTRPYSRPGIVEKVKFCCTHSALKQPFDEPNNNLLSCLVVSLVSGLPSVNVCCERLVTAMHKQQHPLYPTHTTHNLNKYLAITISITIYTHMHKTGNAYIA